MHDIVLYYLKFSRLYVTIFINVAIKIITLFISIEIIDIY